MSVYNEKKNAEYNYFCKRVLTCSSKYHLLTVALTIVEKYQIVFITVYFWE